MLTFTALLLPKNTPLTTPFGYAVLITLMTTCPETFANQINSIAEVGDAADVQDRVCAGVDHFKGFGARFTVPIDGVEGDRMRIPVREVYVQGEWRSAVPGGGNSSGAARNLERTDVAWAGVPGVVQLALHRK